MTASNFIKDLGGASAVARAIQVPMTTVATWAQKERIPHWRMPALAKLAKRQGKIVPADLAASMKARTESVAGGSANRNRSAA